MVRASTRIASDARNSALQAELKMAPITRPAATTVPKLTANRVEKRKKAMAIAGAVRPHNTKRSVALVDNICETQLIELLA